MRVSVHPPKRLKAAVITALFVALWLPMAGVAQSDGLVERWRVEGFVFPESARVLSDGRVVVSDRGAGGNEADGRIALIGADGAVVSQDWVTGLVNPLGMAEANGRLYVVDGAVGVQVIDIASARLLDPIPLPGVRLANDIAAGPDGTLYVTDTASEGVVQIRDGVSGWLAPPGSIPAPNGIVWSGNRVVVGSMGEGLNLSDFSVASPGGLFSLDPATGEVAAIAASQGSARVDGVADFDGMLVYNDNPTGRVLSLGESGLTEIGVTAPRAGALGGAGDLLVVPQIGAGYVAAFGFE